MFMQTFSDTAADPLSSSLQSLSPRSRKDGKRKPTRGHPHHRPPAGPLRYCEFHVQKNAGALGRKCDQYSSMQLRRIKAAGELHRRRATALLLLSGAIIVSGTLMVVVGYADLQKSEQSRKPLRDVGEIVLCCGGVVFLIGVAWILIARYVHRMPDSLSSKNKTTDILSRTLPKPSVMLWREDRVRGMPLNVSSISINVDSSHVVPSAWHRVYRRCQSVQKVISSSSRGGDYQRQLSVDVLGRLSTRDKYARHAEGKERRRNSIDNSDIVITVDDDELDALERSWQKYQVMSQTPELSPWDEIVSSMKTKQRYTPANDGCTREKLSYLAHKLKRAAGDETPSPESKTEAAAMKRMKFAQRSLPKEICSNGLSQRSHITADILPTSQITPPSLDATKPSTPDVPSPRLLTYQCSTV